ncbi:MAG: 3D domain-containing protein [Gammaproteobacteria bacterium]
MKIKHILATVSITFLSFVAWKIGNTPIKSSYFPQILPHNKAFSVLSGWENADLKPSFHAFLNSCKLFLRQNPEQNVGSAHFSLKAKDWQPICKAAKTVNTFSKYSIRSFFQTWFKPVAVSGNKPAQGKFTGYYAATIHGSRSQTDKYSIPVRSIDKKGAPLAWVASHKDIGTLVLEGSAVIEFDNGSHLAIEYVKGGRSSPYFQETEDHQFHGAQDVALTPGYSMAVDRQWIPLGTPLWLNTEIRQDFSKKAQPFSRLMIAQDIGSAIRGAVRGDMYWGPGERATLIANNIRNQGSYWLLLPKTAKV